QRDPVQRSGPECPVPGGGVTEPDSEHDPRVEAGPTGEQLPGPGPVDDLAARYPARPEDQIGGGQGGKQARKLLRLVGAIGIHLHDRAVPVLNGPAEPGDIGRAEPVFPGPVQHVDAGVLRRELVSEFPGAVRAVVIHDQQVSIRHRAANPADDGFQALPLVVGGDDDRYVPGRAAGWVRTSQLSACLPFAAMAYAASGAQLHAGYRRWAATLPQDSSQYRNLACCLPVLGQAP